MGTGDQAAAGNLQSLVGRALSDDQFAQRLIDTPEAALREVGVEPTAEMVDALRGLDVAALKRLAAAFGEKSAA